MSLYDIIKQNTHELGGLKLPLVLGTDVQGKNRFKDLVDLEHILMAGSTGSGKSVFENTIITTLLQLLPPSEIRFFLVDMKRVDLVSYRDLPQLYTEVLVDAKQVLTSLDLLIKEKERRLTIHNKNYPFIIVIIDTISDLMEYDSNTFEEILAHLIPEAIKVKIHVIISDSRSSVQVFTQKIRKYFPTRVCFNLSNAADEALILESQYSGADKLRGKGDMLFLPPGALIPERIQAPFISEKEISQIIESQGKIKLNK